MTKLETLKKYFADLGSVLIAYSGGVDSTFLLKVATLSLASDKILAVTAKSKAFPVWELDFAVDMVKELGVTHQVIQSNELDNPEFIKNSKDRCYWCKHELFTQFMRMAKLKGFNYVIDGANLDDESDYRPGMKAASELGIKSPLKEMKFTKEDIRKFSKQLGLPNWDKPAFACLGSRFPYGETISEAALEKILSGERFLLDLGFGQLRVRHHKGEIARIEVLPADFLKVIENKEVIVQRFQQIGYNYVSLDLKGYRTGSMNEVLK